MKRAEYWMMNLRLLPVCLLMLSGAAHAQTPRSAATPTPARSTAADDDARRAAATRLLAASRFRERQVVLMSDAQRAAESELTEECINRAAAGQNLKACDVLAAPGAASKARLAAAEPKMVDEVMTASQTIYARHFSAAEMDEITRFFRTPVGQRYGEVYPQILSEIQKRKRAIVRRYLAAAAAPGTMAP